jgi:hypothetical protein
MPSSTSSTPSKKEDSFVSTTSSNIPVDDVWVNQQLNIMMMAKQEQNKVGSKHPLVIGN